MQFFSILKFEIATGVTYAGDQWPEAIDYFVSRMEREETNVMGRPRIVLGGGQGQCACLKYEPSLGGCYAYASGGATGQAVAPEEHGVFRCDQNDLGAVLSAFQVLLGLRHRAVSLTFPDLSATSQLVLLLSGTQLQVGHAGLPGNLATYGSKTSGLRPKQRQPLRA